MIIIIITIVIMHATRLTLYIQLYQTNVTTVTSVYECNTCINNTHKYIHTNVQTIQTNVTTVEGH